LKKYLVLTVLLFSFVLAKAQYNTITLSGGYVFSNIEDSEASASVETAVDDRRFYFNKIKCNLYYLRFLN